MPFLSPNQQRQSNKPAIFITSQGCFPAEFKEAIVLPLLNRDLTDLKNYRPVFNLPFLS